MGSFRFISCFTITKGIILTTTVSIFSSLTLEGVRRALEKDMGLETYSLDAHKKFIKQCVDKVFHDSDDENASNNASEMAEAKDDHLSKEGSEDVQTMPASKKVSSSADEQVVRSSGTEKEPNGEEDQASGSNIGEDMIKEAIDKRASYFRKNSETLTLQGVRRTLEEDLKLAKKALDAYKKFITAELDRVLQEPANGTKKSSKQGPHKDADPKSSKASKRAREDSDTSENDNQSGMEDSDEDARPRKRGSEKVKVMKRQKKARDEKKLLASKAKKVAKRDSDRSTEEQDGNSAGEDNSQSSAEEDNKRKRQPAPTYGKQLIVFWTEIKAVKKRKERAKELEGIDMSNIITSSRRRNTSNFIPLPPPKVAADSDDSDDEDDAQDDEDDDEEIVEGADESDNDVAEGDDGSADDAEKKD
ncbi:hypothetical protein PR202_ga22243 [Eleusine coracana subsp. coracana]|uniref:Histone chaperone domain-containing protein n=1 Tax=Eleusine coracana subsp. coracana TaxID=191504 RepID=A0AAV5D153_ELECO|nr:hypothetical protein PR202_ga22243 [Eleusine coracana subsp. coracana]